MSRDQKIGLALGILLVGAVAAFFYRHEESTVSPLPELKSAAEMDRRISEGPLAPYVNTPATNRTPSNTVDELDSGLQEAPIGLVPHPIALEPDQSAGSQTRFASSTNKAAGSTTAGVNVSVPQTTHTVKRGDTLSSIAAQYLGNAARFEEVYEANRDRLRDANDLKIGQELRIPGLTGGGSMPANPNAQDSLPASSPPRIANDPETGTPLRFVPFPGQRGSAPRTANETPETNTSGAVRRFSQLPPEDITIRR